MDLAEACVRACADIVGIHGEVLEHEETIYEKIKHFFYRKEKKKKKKKHNILM